MLNQAENEDTLALLIDEDQIVAGKNVFRFDKVWPGSTSQEDIYAALVQPLVTKVRVVSFAYCFNLSVSNSSFA